MTETLPAPPIDPFVDVQSFDEMPLNVVRLCNADILAETTPEEFKAAVVLWARAWHQVPAGSLPNDDRKLCYMAGFGYDLRRWKRVRKGALRGFELCSDGRLYHAIIVEYAREAWSKKSTGKENAQRRWEGKSRRAKNGQPVETTRKTPMQSHEAKTSGGSADPDGNGDGKQMQLDVGLQCSEQNRTDSNRKRPPSNPPLSDPPDTPKPDPVADAFARFKQAYPKRDGDNPWPDALAKFRAAVKRGHDPTALVAAAEGFRVAMEAKGKIGTEFIPMARTWLNQDRFVAYLQTAAAQDDPGLPASREIRNGVPLIVWVQRYRLWRTKTIWLASYGRTPDEEGNLVPPEARAIVDAELAAVEAA